MNSGYISVVPKEPVCGERVAIVGGGFPQNVDIDIMTLAPFDDPILVLTIPADGTGGFLLELAATFFDECSPGQAYALIAGPSGTQPGTPAPWPRAIFETAPPGSLAVTPTVAKCGEQLTVTGDGFPPGSTVRLLMGQDDSFAHNFASLTTTTADGEGRISVSLPMLPLGGQCLPQHQAIIARAEDSAGFPGQGGWRAPFVILP